MCMQGEIRVDFLNVRFDSLKVDRFQTRYGNKNATTTHFMFKNVTFIISTHQYKCKKAKMA